MTDDRLIIEKLLGGHLSYKGYPKGPTLSIRERHFDEFMAGLVKAIGNACERNEGRSIGYTEQDYLDPPPGSKMELCMDIFREDPHACPHEVAKEAGCSYKYVLKARRRCQARGEI